jgi:hypothetical protein
MNQRKVTLYVDVVSPFAYEAFHILQVSKNRPPLPPPPHNIKARQLLYTQQDEEEWLIARKE